LLELLSAKFLIFVLFLNDFTIKNGSKHSVEVLSSDPSCKKAGICLTETMHC
jgi:hypothetical protein